MSNRREQRNNASNFLEQLQTYQHPASQKVFVEGSRPDIQVSMRQIAQTPSQIARADGTIEQTDNPPINVYDTSGPYSDPNATINLEQGLAPLRAQWINDRQDVEELDLPTSEFTRQRSSETFSGTKRFPQLPTRMRAKTDRRVTQLHYARAGIITP